MGASLQVQAASCEMSAARPLRHAMLIFCTVFAQIAQTIWGAGGCGSVINACLKKRSPCRVELLRPRALPSPPHLFRRILSVSCRRLPDAFDNMLQSCSFSLVPVRACFKPPPMKIQYANLCMRAKKVSYILNVHKSNYE